MIKVASDIGFDASDIELLGENLDRSKFMANVMQLNADRMKNLDRLYRNEPIGIKGQEAYDKIKCHPMMKDTVRPIVQYFWVIWPFNYLCLECFPYFELLMCCNPCGPCLWCFYVPFIYLILPWNYFWEILLSPIVIFCFPCYFGSLVLYYLVMPPWEELGVWDRIYIEY